MKWIIPSMSIMKTMLPPITIASFVLSKTPVFKLGSIVNFILKGMQTMNFLNSIKDFFNTITGNSDSTEKVGIVKSIFRIAKNGIKFIVSIGTGLWTFVVRTVKDVIKGVTSIFNSDLSFGGKLMELGKGIFSFVKNGAIYIYERIKDAFEVVKPALNYVAELISTGFEIVSTFFKGIFGSKSKETENSDTQNSSTGAPEPSVA